jgi:cell division protein FtsB
VWNARQSTIDALKKENEQLKNKIAGLEANK